MARMGHGTIVMLLLLSFESTLCVPVAQQGASNETSLVTQLDPALHHATSHGSRPGPAPPATSAKNLQRHAFAQTLSKMVFSVCGGDVKGRAIRPSIQKLRDLSPGMAIKVMGLPNFDEVVLASGKSVQIELKDLYDSVPKTQEMRSIHHCSSELIAQVGPEIHYRDHIKGVPATHRSAQRDAKAQESLQLLEEVLETHMSAPAVELELLQLGDGRFLSGEPIEANAETVEDWYSYRPEDRILKNTEPMPLNWGAPGADAHMIEKVFAYDKFVKIGLFTTYLNVIIIMVVVSFTLAQETFQLFGDGKMQDFQRRFGMKGDKIDTLVLERDPFVGGKSIVQGGASLDALLYNDPLQAEYYPQKCGDTDVEKCKQGLRLKIMSGNDMTLYQTLTSHGKSKFRDLFGHDPALLIQSPEITGSELQNNELMSELPEFKSSSLIRSGEETPKYDPFKQFPKAYRAGRANVDLAGVRGHLRMKVLRIALGAPAPNAEEKRMNEARLQLIKQNMIAITDVGETLFYANHGDTALDAKKEMAARQQEFHSVILRVIKQLKINADQLSKMCYVGVSPSQSAINDESSAWALQLTAMLGTDDDQKFKQCQINAPGLKKFNLFVNLDDVADTEDVRQLDSKLSSLSMGLTPGLQLKLSQINTAERIDAIYAVAVQVAKIQFALVLMLFLRGDLLRVIAILRQLNMNCKNRSEDTMSLFYGSPMPAPACPAFGVSYFSGWISWLKNEGQVLSLFPQDDLGIPTEIKYICKTSLEPSPARRKLRQGTESGGSVVLAGKMPKCYQEPPAWDCKYREDNLRVPSCAVGGRGTKYKDLESDVMQTPHAAGIQDIGYTVEEVAWVYSTVDQGFKKIGELPVELEWDHSDLDVKKSIKYKTARIKTLAQRERSVSEQLLVDSCYGTVDGDPLKPKFDKGYLNSEKNKEYTNTYMCKNTQLQWDELSYIYEQDYTTVQDCMSLCSTYREGETTETTVTNNKFFHCTAFHVNFNLKTDESGASFSSGCYLFDDANLAMGSRAPDTSDMKGLHVWHLDRGLRTQFMTDNSVVVAELNVLRDHVIFYDYTAQEGLRGQIAPIFKENEDESLRDCGDLELLPEHKDMYRSLDFEIRYIDPLTSDECADLLALNATYSREATFRGLDEDKHDLRTCLIGEVVDDQDFETDILTYPLRSSPDIFLTTMRNIGRDPGSSDKENYYRWIRSNRFNKSEEFCSSGVAQITSAYQVKFQVTDIHALDPRATHISSFGFGCSDEIEVRDVCARKQGYFDSFLQPSTDKLIPFPVVFDTAQSSNRYLSRLHGSPESKQVNARRRRQSAKGLVAASLEAADEAADEQHTEHNQAATIEDADTVTSLSDTTSDPAPPPAEVTATEAAPVVPASPALADGTEATVEGTTLMYELDATTSPIAAKGDHEVVSEKQLSAMQQMAKLAVEPFNMYADALKAAAEKVGMQDLVKEEEAVMNGDHALAQVGAVQQGQGWVEPIWQAKAQMGKLLTQTGLFGIGPAAEAMGLRIYQPQAESEKLRTSSMPGFNSFLETATRDRPTDETDPESNELGLNLKLLGPVRCAMQVITLYMFLTLVLLGARLETFRDGETDSIFGTPNLDQIRTNFGWMALLQTVLLMCSLLIGMGQYFFLVFQTLTVARDAIEHGA